MEKEIWKDIKGYEGYYQVSDHGRVKSLKRLIRRSDGVDYYNNEKIRKLSIGTTGYYIVTIYKNSKPKTFKVHRLVASTFMPNSKNGNFVNHKDFNKKNNKLENLEWVTNYQNILHYKNENGPEYNIHGVIELYKKTGSTEKVAKKYGMSESGVTWLLKQNNIKKIQNKGRTASKSRVVDMYSIDGEYIKRFYTITEAFYWLEKQNPKRVSKKQPTLTNIYKCCKKEIKSAYGYKWELIGKTKDILSFE